MPAQTVPNVIPSDLLVSVEEVSLVSGQRSAVIMAVGWFFLTSIVLLHFLE